MSYRIAIEPFDAAFPDVEPLCRVHYAEMKARMTAEGMQIGDYNPRWNIYRSAPHLLCFVVRTDEGEAVGYAFIWITQDMHNSELIAREDTIFVRKDHRNGVGRRLTKRILSDLK
ncbi:MAG TPA: GNAT family N-acetyltransferase, partial [Pararhizobium sp.]|nr:GNAT family N-acetyltransferase [Pararhizobium sp.]